ncbi:NADP dehydrogenase [ubiquinone] 1 beta subcomplex subunit 7 [Plakobranchus ocellatus]|uniref:NADH dehydrogenase [ubiquinone] 1 beta subcomplex subunit 7 n=1 Tax=Plakobranchus ocellatus TaxID=259542 RepID=A0AAV4BHR7_9GAST|nr:NADP dehydrogenase [ubiquinone] 1 beta subcomplex subunit 7 [Plakobranchus ocellatus]
MGNMWYTYVTNPDTAPDYKNPPTFDPLYGFPEGREERKICATRQQLDRAKVPIQKRDYCVDYYMKFLECRQQHFPRVWTHCHHQIHDWEHCQIEDTVLRVKEWERERRLKERAKRKAKQESMEAME